jgi:stearoyl-CoA desaturase (delta-9 desaturase)
MYFALCALVFASAYLLNAITITVVYHRGLAHGAVRLHPAMQATFVTLGSWITGLDAKAWVVMHRMHHAHSDTASDPHSPVNVGLLGIGLEQLRSYKLVLTGLLKEDPHYTKHAKDLGFDVHWLNRRGLWYLPYVFHASIGITFASLGFWLLGLVYFAGMMSHPLQGGLVNSLGHAVGGRNFETKDNSRNNLLVAWLVFGEGLQNNHHRFPKSAKFSYHRWEPDLGFATCLMFESLGLLTVDPAHLIPLPVPQWQHPDRIQRAA